MFLNFHGQRSVPLTIPTLMKFMEIQLMSIAPSLLKTPMHTLLGVMPTVITRSHSGRAPLVVQNLLSGDPKEKAWRHGLTCSPLELKSPTTLLKSCSNTGRILIKTDQTVCHVTNSEFLLQKCHFSPPTLKWTFLILTVMESYKEMNWKLSKPCPLEAPMSVFQVSNFRFHFRFSLPVFTSGLNFIFQVQKTFSTSWPKCILNLVSLMLLMFTIFQNTILESWQHSFQNMKMLHYKMMQSEKMHFEKMHSKMMQRIAT